MGILGKLFTKNNTRTSDSGSISKSASLDFTPDSFNDLYERFALLSFAKQKLLGDVIGNKSWQFNMAEGALSFEGDPVFPMQLIGSVSFLDNTWMWSWANTQSGIPPNLQRHALNIKGIGEKYSINELTEAKINISEGFEHKIGAIAAGICNAQAYYCANYGKGTAVVTIGYHPSLNNDPVRIGNLVMSSPAALSALDVNHVNAFKHFLQNLNYETSIEGNMLTAIQGEKRVIAEFDEQYRLISLNV